MIESHHQKVTAAHLKREAYLRSIARLQLQHHSSCGAMAWLLHRREAANKLIQADQSQAY